MIRIFEQLKLKFQPLIDLAISEHGGTPFEYKQGCVLRYTEAVQLLRNDGQTIDDYADFSTAHERRLGSIVKDKYQTDFFIIERFPLRLRPFYTMADAEDSTFSNSYDFYMRGNEILSGAQRINDYGQLLTKVQDASISPDAVQGYLDSFKYGMPMHAGGGIGNVFADVIENPR